MNKQLIRLTSSLGLQSAKIMHWLEFGFTYLDILKSHDVRRKVSNLSNVNDGNV